MNKPIELGAYFYPLTTQCPIRQDRAKAIGELVGVLNGLPVPNEIALAHTAVPLFDGHQQPRRYVLGRNNIQWDDSNEADVARQVDLASDAGLNFFIFDTFEGVKGGVPQYESHRPMELFRGLSSTMKYAKLETFASPRVLLPVSQDPGFYEPDRIYDMDEHTARYIVDSSVSNDWDRSNYFRVNDRPYLSLFAPDLTPGYDTSPSRMRHVVGKLREYSQSKYNIDPYIVGSVRTLEQGHDLTAAGVDALSGYAFLPEFGNGVEPLQDYSEQLEKRKREWEIMKRINTFVPPAVVGWDASPRGKSVYQLGTTSGYSYAPIVTDATPELFESMLVDSLDFVGANVPQAEQYGIVCAWNEVTEGAALLPQLSTDGTLDTSYLDVIRRVTSGRRTI